MITSDFEELVDAKRVRLIEIGDPMHDHWNFELGGVYDVTNANGFDVAIVDGDGDHAFDNWGDWVWEVVE